MAETTLRTGEEWHRILGDAAPGFLWITDASGRIVYANQTWQQYTGSSVEEINTRGRAYFNHPDEAAVVGERWSRALEQGKPFEMELRYRRHDGVFRWMLARVIPRRDHTGRITNWVGTSVDIDGLKQAEAALRRREQELSDFFESATVPIHWIGPDGVILRVNQAELDLLGYGREEYVGRNIAEFHADADVIRDILHRLTAGEVLNEYPAKLRCKDGSIKQVLIDSSVYRQDGAFVHTRCFTRDVTAVRGAEVANARLAAIVSSSSDAIVGKTLEGLVTSWNTASERIFGYSEAEMVGQSIFRLIPEELHQAERDLLERIARGEVVQFSETERIRKDGQKIYIAVTVSPIRNSRGEVVGASSIKRDVTERKQAAEALARSQERLQLALQAARMGAWQWDVRSNVLTWDEGLCRLYGVEAGAVTQYQQFLERVHPEDRDFVAMTIQRAIDAGDALDYELRIVLPDGRIRWLADHGRLVRDPQGRPLYMTGVCIDITDRRDMEERLRQSQRMDAVGQLAGGIAHEANNMMSVVLGCADYVLQTEGLAPAVRDDVDQIWRAAKRTAGITQQLLAFSRRQVLQPRVLDLNQTVRQLEPILARSLGETRGLCLHLDAGVGSVRADPGQLEQVLINLTLNARDAMPEGGSLTLETARAVLDAPYAVRKAVRTLRPGEYVVLVVTDTGHGMDRETQSQIFEPFFTTKPVGQGTGLGLSTVYGIVKQTGGYVWAYSEPGLGSTFKVYLPVANPSTDPELPTSADRVAGANEVVLVAEDEPMVRAIMARTLRDCGYQVIEAADGGEALQKVEERGDVDLIVADVVMPGLGGRELAARLSDRHPAIPMLFTSGYTGLDVVRRGLLDEGREFLQKPLDPDALTRKVREMLDSRVTPD